MVGKKGGKSQTTIHTTSWLSSNYTQQPALPPELQLRPAKLSWSERLSPIPATLHYPPSTTTAGNKIAKVRDNV